MSDFRISQVAASPSMTEPSTSGSERKLDRPAVVLGARSICKSFGRRAAAHQVLFDVDVDVYEGECLAVIGGSGSGKSTLTRIMLGLENADGGTVEYRGTPVLRGGSGLRRLRHDSGLIYQDPYGSLDPRWTVGDIVAEPLSLRRRGSRPDPAGIRENVHAALERVGLDAGVFIDRYPMDLSGGQAQRTALARIMVSDPKLLLLDEPFSALDAHLRDKLMIEIRDVLARFGREVIMVTHSRDEAYNMSREIAVMDGGKLLTKNKTKALFADPGSVPAAILTGCKNIASAEKRGEHEVYIPEWGVTLTTAQSVGDDVKAIGIRAHYFNPTAPTNRFAVEYIEEMEEPFEWIIEFRPRTAAADAQGVWWRLSKDKRPQSFPAELGIAPANILLLY